MCGDPCAPGRAEANFWKTEEVELEKDVVVSKKRTDNERQMVESVVAFFAASDGVVVNNLVESCC